jgi:hypothetical protein
MMGEALKNRFFNTQYSSIPFFHYSKDDSIVPLLKRGDVYGSIF